MIGRILLSCVLISLGYYYARGQLKEPQIIAENKEQHMAILIDSLDEAISQHDTFNIVRFSSSLTTQFHGIRMRDRAKHYSKIALQYSINSSDSSLFPNVCNRMGMLYFSFRHNNDSSEFSQMVDTSIFWHRKAVELGDNGTAGWGHRGLLSAFIDIYKWGNSSISDSINYHFEKCLQIANEENDIDLFEHSIRRYSTFLVLTKQWKKLREIIDDLEKVGVNPGFRRMGMGILRHDYIAGINDLDTLTKLRVQIINDFASYIASGHKKNLYEADKKFEVTETKGELENTLEELAQSRIILFTLLAGSILILLALFYFYRLNQKNKRLSARNELLLKEQNHRVKNNLQMINSLLSLQSQKLLSSDAKEALNESQLRINSVALLHRMLYEDENVGKVNAKEYLKTLTEEINYAVPREVDLHLYITEGLSLAIERATSLGLIINELMTNSIKHVEEDISLRIEIELKQIGNELTLNYSDNGSGISEEVWNTSRSFGNQLIKIQSEQLRGSYEIINTEGFKYELKMGA